MTDKTDRAKETADKAEKVTGVVEKFMSSSSHMANAFFIGRELWDWMAGKTSKSSSDSADGPRSVQFIKMVRGGMFSAVDEADMQRLLHEIQSLVQKKETVSGVTLEDNILEVFSIYRSFVYGVYRDWYMGGTITKYYLNQLRLYILTLRDPSRTEPYTTTQGEGKEKTVTKGEHVIAPDSTHAILFLNRMAKVFNKAIAESELKRTSNKEAVACKAIADWLATESFPSPWMTGAVRGFAIKLKAGLNESFEEGSPESSLHGRLRESIHQGSEEYLKRKATLPWWRRLLRS